MTRPYPTAKAADVDPHGLFERAQTDSQGLAQLMDERGDDVACHHPAPAVEGWRYYDAVKPEPGRKFVILCNDGSGATLHYAHDGGYIDSDGDETDDIAYGGIWAYLPDGVEFWCEARAEDPLTLPTVPAAPPPPQDGGEVGRLREALEWLLHQMEEEQRIGVAGFEDWIAHTKAAIGGDCA